MKLVLAVLLTLSSFSMAANWGEGNEDKVRSTIQVLDAETGEPIIGADIHIDGLDEVLYTDPDGIVELDYVQNSKSVFRISYVSYEDETASLNDLSSTTVITLRGRQ